VRPPAAATLVLILGLSLPAAAEPRPTRSELLRLSTAYVVEFERAFSRIVGTERYQQTIRRGERNQDRRMRQIESEIFFAGIGDGLAWMTIRNVLTVDGQAVPSSHDRIMDALNGGIRENRARLKALADESARYNLGAVERNFNDPTLTLTFLDPRFRDRFRFEIDGRDEVDGTAVSRIAFRETVRPTLIRNERDGSNAPASGELLIDDDGRVWQSALKVATRSDTTAEIRVRYEFESKLEMLVPRTMDEDYRGSARNGATLISCHASYSNYRRFETSGRIVGTP